VDKYHVLSRKRHFPAFWVVTEESIPLSKLASIQIHRGFLFSKLIVENSGGPYPIIVDGLWNGPARTARDLLEEIERGMQNREDVSTLVGDDHDSPQPPSPTSPQSPSGSGGGGGEKTVKSTGMLMAIAPEVRPAPARSRSTSIRAAQSGSTQGQPIEPVQLDLGLNRKNALQAACEMKINGRTFGELPSEEWKPAPPWSPVDARTAPEARYVNQDFVEEIGTIEGESLLDEPKTSVAVDEEQPLTGEKTDRVEALTNWWENARQAFRPPELYRHKRRRRKLN
jgi:hypothetical protein